MLAPDGRARIEIIAREDLDDSDALERFVGDVRTIVPEASGSAVWMIALGEVTWNAMLWALLGGITCIVIFLVLLWQSVWDTALALFPLLLAAGLTCATIVLGGDDPNPPGSLPRNG